MPVIEKNGLECYTGSQTPAALSALGKGPASVAEGRQGLCFPALKQDVSIAKGTPCAYSPLPVSSPL